MPPITPSEPASRPRVLFVTVGCRANQADSRMLAEALPPDEFASLEEAPDCGVEICVINSCTVTQRADSDTRAAVRRCARRYPGARIVVTGCMATVASLELQGLAPVAAVVPNGRKHDLVQVLRALDDHTGAPLVFAPSGPPAPVAFRAPSAITALPPRRTRPQLKIQDGCDGGCAYCIVPAARGPGRSQPAAEVLASIARYAELGAREVVLTGIHVGRYGCDLTAPSKPRSLAALLSAIDERLSSFGARVPRIRLSSIEPDEVTDDLLAVLARGRFCRHLHLPLQSGDDGVLARMGRRYDTVGYRTRLAAVRRRLPGVTVGADVLVGFPGESEAEFVRSLEFIERCRFDYLHVFGYSRRDGTRASTMGDQVPAGVIKRRVASLRVLGERLYAGLLARHEGEHAEALIEGPLGTRGDGHFGRDRLAGLTGTYVPVALPPGAGAKGELVPVLIGRAPEGGRRAPAEVV